MKIVVAHSNLGGLGGGERFVLEEVKHLSKRHDVKIVTWEYIEEDTLPGFKKYEIEELKSGSLPLKKLLTWARYKGLADVFSTHGFPSNFLSFRNRNTIWYCHILNLPFHNSYKPDYVVSRFFDRQAVKRTDKIVANSRFTQELIKRHYNRNSVVITPGVEPKEFKPGRCGDYVLLVSRISPEKNIQLALDAMELVPDIKLIVVAGWVDRNYYKKLKFSSERIELFEHVPETKLRELYSNCLCVVQTATSEPFGMVPLEAMASGKPVIAPKRGGFMETVTEETGFLIEPTAEAMARKIDYLDKNRDIAKRMGKSGVKRARGFTWEKKMEAFERVLTESGG
ncbi:MAG: glycosyltransferase family 4 protein [Candidatus Aenigmarchaeota archaeon]|nr:glycosyltransferase family 4 protein [Candidatus Aenigmarchaeota archaeon]